MSLRAKRGNLTFVSLRAQRGNLIKRNKKRSYGFIIENHEKLGRIIGHAGGFFGISSNLDMYLDTGYTVVVMTNYGGGVEVVSGEIQKVIQSLVSKQPQYSSQDHHR